MRSTEKQSFENTSLYAPLPAAQTPLFDEAPRFNKTPERDLANTFSPRCEREVERCKHCGLALVAKWERKCGFCCTGCHGAYEFIHGLGLSDFYTRRERGPEWCALPSAEVHSTFEAFDDEVFQAQFAQRLEWVEGGHSEPPRRVSFHLVGLHCAACVWLLEKLPEILPGVLEARVSMVREGVMVTFDPTKTKVSQVARALASLGYKPHPVVTGGVAKRVREDRTFALQLGVAAFCSMNVMLFFVGRYAGIFSGMEVEYARYFSWLSLFLALPAVFFSAVPFYRTSLAGIRMGRLHIDLPITMAILGSFIASAINSVLGRPELYFDTITMLIFLLLCGRWCQRSAMRRVQSASELLYSLTPMEALKRDESGVRREVFVESLALGDEVVVGKGRRFPCDGEVVEGESLANVAVLTGESAPVLLTQGTLVWAGSKNLSGEVVVRVTASGAASRLGALIAGIQELPGRKSRTAKFTEKVSAYFVAGIVVLSVGVFCYWLSDGFWIGWDRMIAVLIVSCPCALGIATPVTLSLASSEAGRRGLLIRGTDALESLASIREVVFDKTGTLTTGRLGVVDTLFVEGEASEIWRIVSHLERGVEHPVAEALRRTAERYEGSESEARAGEFQREEVCGRGVKAATVSGELYRLGAVKWLESCGVSFSESDERFMKEMFGGGCSVVGLAVEGGESASSAKLLALFALGDSLRPEARRVIAELQARGKPVSILSGDNPAVVHRIAEELGIPPEVTRGELTPEEKKREVLRRGEGVLFVGDGVNDAPALSAATVGVGITGGAELCLKVADVFLTVPDLSLLPLMLDGARRTERLVYRHLLISLFYNVTAASLAVVGFIGPLAAALVMPASSLSVISSSLAARPFRGGTRWG